MPSMPKAEANMVYFSDTCTALRSQSEASIIHVETINSDNDCKMIHRFTCAGVLPSQYKNMSQFAGIGTIGDSYIREGYLKCNNTLV